MGHTTSIIIGLYALLFLCYNISIKGDIMHYCINCSDNVPTQRWLLGYKTCLTCGEQLARSRRHTIVPLAKSNYIPVTDTTMLKQLNKYSRI